MTLHRTVRVAILFTVATVVAGIALAVRLRPRERSLLASATRIAAIDHAHPWYWWLSDHEVLLFRDPVRGDWTLVCHDENAKRDRPIEGLTRLYARTRGRPESIQVSPDGKWILWSSAAGATTVSTTDGVRHFDYAPRKPSEKRWMCESVRWVELVHDDRFFTHAFVHNVMTPHKSERRVVNPPVPCTPEFVDLRGIAPTTDEHILVNLWNGRVGNIDPAAILALGMNAQLSGVGQIKLAPPHPSDRGELVFAPIYGRLAWVLQYRPAWSTLTREPMRTGIWVTDMHGANIHPMGSVETAGDTPVSPGSLAVRWTPDGGRLSFIYRDALWTVSAD